MGLTQVPPRTRAADVGAEVRSAAGVGVADECDGGASVASGEAAPGVAGAGDEDWEVEAAPHAATMTMAVSRAVTEREVVPVIVCPFWDAWAQGSDVSASLVRQ